MNITRTSLAAVVTAAVSAGLLAAAPASAQTRPRPVPLEPAGFVSVATFGGIVATSMPVALDAVRADELWIAMRDPDGRLSMHRAKGPGARVDRTQRLTVNAEPGDPIVVDGSGGEAWLSASGSLWHLDSGRWRHVSTVVAAGSAPTVTTVADAPGPGAYVGLSRFDESQGRSRSWVAWTDGNTWRALPGGPGQIEGKEPIIGGRDLTPRVNRIRVAGGQVFAEWRTDSVTRRDEVFAYAGGKWQSIYSAGFVFPYGAMHVTAWLVPNARRHLLLGEVFSGSHRETAHHIEGFAHTWAPRSGMQRGTTTGLVGAAAVLANGKTVIGNNAYKGEVTSLPSGFVLRSTAGKETPLGGDAGSETLAMTSVPGSNTAWALTRNGETIQLQRYKG